MKDFLKKNWFVGLIVLVFAGFSIFYIYDTNKGKLKGKKINGEDVVYSLTDKDVTVSDFYDYLYKGSGQNSIVTLFERAVVDAGITTTDEIKDNAEQQAASITASFQEQYGSSYETYLSSALAETGYTNIVDYLITQLKKDQLTADYAKANFNDLQIRDIYYVLIKFETPGSPADEPTEDEAARMKAVDDALAEGKTFQEAATAYSEDSSTAPNGGSLGVIDKNSSLDTAFLEAALALNEGETTDWVRSTSTEFGYFKIYCPAATQATLESQYVDQDPYVLLTTTNDSTLANYAIWEKAQELEIDFKGNADIESFIKDSYGASDSATSEETTEEGGDN